VTDAVGDPTRAFACVGVEISEHPQNLAAGWVLTPLAFERFDLVAARCELDRAHRAFSVHPCALTHQRLTRALRRYRALIDGGR
jgi:hypothetical protein